MALLPLTALVVVPGNVWLSFDSRTVYASAPGAPGVPGVPGEPLLPLNTCATVSVSETPLAVLDIFTVTVDVDSGVVEPVMVTTLPLREVPDKESIPWR